MVTLYLDMCCLKRPFDDQRSSRIRRETEAVAALVDRAERGLLGIVRSPALEFENRRNPREDRRLAAALWLGGATFSQPFDESVGQRAGDLEKLGFGPLDALHTAFAEAAGCRWLATTDDRLASLGGRHREGLRVAIANPIGILEHLVGDRP